MIARCDVMGWIYLAQDMKQWRAEKKIVPLKVP
jgi:hypothetical protein